MDNPPPLDQQAALDTLQDFVRRHPELVVLTGAGISTASGIPAYRDADGHWRGREPIQWGEFLNLHSVRQRYWARSMVGWPVVAKAKPNAAHHALARMQQQGHIARLVTQNVDGLHHAAGSHDVIELHGNIGSASCLDCGCRYRRADLQVRLEADNPGIAKLEAFPAPDGDAQIPYNDFSSFQAPHCDQCGGVLKPDVVFFGESVPRERVDTVRRSLAKADALLVVGSSLTVYSGFRFCLAAAQQMKPIAAINLGATRADDLLAIKVELPCGPLLSALVRPLSLPRP